MSKDLCLFLGAVVSATFAIARLSLIQQRASAEQMMEFLDRLVERQGHQYDRLGAALESLQAGMVEVNVVLRRWADAMRAQFSSGGDPWESP